MNRWGGGHGGLTDACLDRQGDKPPAHHLISSPSVLLCQALGGTDGASSGVPP